MLSYVLKPGQNMAYKMWKREKIAVILLQSVSFIYRKQNIKPVHSPYWVKSKNLQKKIISNAEMFTQNILKVRESCNPSQQGRKYFQPR